MNKFFSLLLVTTCFTSMGLASKDFGENDQSNNNLGKRSRDLIVDYGEEEPSLQFNDACSLYHFKNATAEEKQLHVLL